MYITPLFCCFVVSLQDINMRKAFKSSTFQDQQVLSKDSASNSVAELYDGCDRPPPLSNLTAYRWNTQNYMRKGFIFLLNILVLIRASCFVLITQTGFHRCNEILLRPFILLWTVEGENASGHRGQEEREAEAEGERALLFCFTFVWRVASFFIPSNGSRNKNDAWKPARFSVKWRRWERPEIAGRSGTWWLWTKSFAQITVIHRVSIEGHHLRALSHQMEGKDI